MYTTKNFKTKASLREAVKNGEKITIFQPGLGAPPSPNSTCAVEGPHYPEPHRWYAKVTLDSNCHIVKVS